MPSLSTVTATQGLGAWQQHLWLLDSDPILALQRALAAGQEISFYCFAKVCSVHFEYHHNHLSKGKNKRIKDLPSVGSMFILIHSSPALDIGDVHLRFCSVCSIIESVG